MIASFPGQPVVHRAWALVPRPGAARLHFVRVNVAEIFKELGGAYVYEVAGTGRGHFVTFGRLASTLARAREVARRELGAPEKSASTPQAGGSPTQAAA